MNIIIVGAGYVGLTAAVCFSEMGNSVYCIENNKEKYHLLKQAILPIHEPQLESFFARNLQQGRLQFFSSLLDIDVAADMYFICVGTPSDPSGHCCLDFVYQAAKDIALHVRAACIVVTKSTVPVGTGDAIERIIKRYIDAGLVDGIDVVSNPEFLKEGLAVDDFMHPDRVIFGVNNTQVKPQLSLLYSPFFRKSQRIMFMSRRDAEMTKYVANAMLASRISFMNEMALLCDKVGVDIESVRQGIGSDKRIGDRFLYAGCGFGGSCFPKDVRALIDMAQASGVDPLMLQASISRNLSQKLYLFQKLNRHFSHNLVDKKVAVWGLSFKPETDDVRMSTAHVLVTNLVEQGAIVHVFDPIANDNFIASIPQRWLDSDQVVVFSNQYEALVATDALVLMTEWKQFRQPDFVQIKQKMNAAVIFDGRNQYDVDYLQQNGFVYYGIGRGKNQIELTCEQVLSQTEGL